MRTRYQAPCRPYDTGNATDPVKLTALLDALTTEQLRQMAISLSVVSPAAFERIIREAKPHEQAKSDPGVAGR